MVTDETLYFTGGFRVKNVKCYHVTIFLQLGVLSGEETKIKSFYNKFDNDKK